MPHDRSLYPYWWGSSSGPTKHEVPDPDPQHPMKQQSCSMSLHYGRTSKSNKKSSLQTWPSPVFIIQYMSPYRIFSAFDSGFMLSPSPHLSFPGSLSPFHRASPAFTFPVPPVLPLTVYIVAFGESSRSSIMGLSFKGN